MIRHYLFIFFLIIFFISPILLLVILSLSGVWQFPDLLPQSFNARAYEYLVQNLGALLTSLVSSFFYSLSVVGITFLMCLLPAKIFAFHEFKGKLALEALLLAPALVPSITFSMGVHVLFIKLGIADSLAGILLVLSIYSYPYMLRALIAGYKAFGQNYDVCAKNLGASGLMRIIQVELPLILPSFVAGGTVVFLVAFSEYFLVFMIGGGVIPSYTGYLFPFLNSSDRPVASLLSLLFFLIPIILFFIIERLVNSLYKKRGILV